MGLVSDSLRRIDTHSGVSNEFRVYTIHGAILSIVTLCIIIYLVITEIYYNFTIHLIEHVHVNATSSTGLEMEFDITLHSVPCKNLEIDSADPTGQSQSLHLDSKHHIWKHRVIFDDTTNKFTYLGSRTKLEMGSTILEENDLFAHLDPENEHELSSDILKEVHMQRKLDKEEGEMTTSNNKSDEDECGSCYGAGEEGECCTTCEDVIRAYRQRGWVFPNDRSGIQQCMDEDLYNKERKLDERENEGCNVHGVVALSTGGGNIHLAPGRDVSMPQSQTFNLFNLILESYHEWNVTHTIHKLRFGTEYPNAVYQLDDITRSITDGHGMYQYYLQIVPTLYKYMNGTTIQTNQYSVTEHLRHVNPGSNRGLPGVFFFYELSPLHVDIQERYNKGYIAFFTSVCAVIGGVITIMGMIDSIIFTSGQNRQYGAGMGTSPGLAR